MTSTPFDTAVRYTSDFLSGLENWWKGQDQEKYKKIYADKNTESKWMWLSDDLIERQYYH